MSNYLTDLYRLCKQLAPKIGKNPEAFRKTVRARVKEILEVLGEEEIVKIFCKSEENGNA